MSNQTLKVYMARVFSAVDITSEQLLKQLEEMQDKLDLGFKTVPREKMHITFEFFEEVEEDEIRELKEAMRRVETEPFDLEVRGIGAFPSEDYIRVVWAGAENGMMHRLYSELSEHHLESSNDHDFKPHITLLRVENVSREDKRKLRKMIKEHRDDSFGKATVDEVKLFESRLTGKGSEYELIHGEEL